MNKFIKKKELMEMYKNNSNKVTANLLGISLVTLNTYLNKYGIEKKGKGNYHNKIKIID